MLPHGYLVLSSCALWHLAMGLPGSVQPRANFVHPGILIDEAQAELIRTKAYANKAITFMDSWASTIKAHNNTNSPLQSGWVASTWARAAELIRYSNAGWSAASITKFEGMLRNVYLPLVKNGAPNYMGNWDLVMAEAAIFIGVFLNDQTVYDAGMTKFLNRVPAYIYLESDGNLPKTAPGDTTTSTQAGIVTYWQGQSVFNVSVTEVSFRALSGRLGYDMPYTEELTLNQRPAGTNKLFVGWETLTNA
ncbi:hypothetical protein BN1723_013059 [Verticillium longisporum]|uniref:Uncharacterized protein n=1 Tax=Verticillium longisporum TaxID=100787 RepID=A0A0G4LNY5_VERLO|nr:hypothetical protein BN1723_013059 [Verticillium longisporum]